MNPDSTRPFELTPHVKSRRISRISVALVLGVVSLAPSLSAATPEELAREGIALARQGHITGFGLHRLMGSQGPQISLVSVITGLDKASGPRVGTAKRIRPV